MFAWLKFLRPVRFSSLVEALNSDAWRRFKAGNAGLKGCVFERDAAINVVDVGLLTSNNVTLVSDPGEGKSLILDLACRRITGSRYFRTELFIRSEPDYIFGPFDLSHFMKTGQARIRTVGHLPAAHFALVDEFYVRNYAVLTGMSSLLHHDEKFFSNAGVAEPSPIKSITAGTNQIPDFSEPENQELVKIHDRILFRVAIAPISERGNFIRMFTTQPPKALAATITFEEFEELQRWVSAVEVPYEIVELVADLWEKFRQSKLWVSSRRWDWVGEALQGKAFLDGRTLVEDYDLLFLQYVLPTDPLKDHKEVYNLIFKTVFPRLHQAMDFSKSAAESLKKAGNEGKPQEPLVEINETVEKLKALLAQARSGYETERIREHLVGVQKIQEKMGKLAENEGDPTP